MTYKFENGQAFAEAGSPQETERLLLRMARQNHNREHNGPFEFCASGDWCAEVHKHFKALEESNVA